MSSRRSVIRVLVLCGGWQALSALAQPAANSRRDSRSEKGAQPGLLAAAAARKTIGNGGMRAALLLPPRLGSFGRAAIAVQFGLEAAYRRDRPDLRIEIVEVEDSPAALGEVYADLVRRGVALAIGPMTRSGVSALALLRDVPVPTLTLNQADENTPIPPNVVVFGISSESEARQIAQLAYVDAAERITMDRAPRAVAIAAPTPLSRRNATAFHDEWLSLGGEAQPPIETEGGDALELRAQLSVAAPDAAFVAMGAEQARDVRALLPPQVVPYGTSQLSIGGFSPVLRLPALDGLRLVDMPWQLQPDHPAVAAYEKPPVPYNAEMQRLYALGIDALRVATALLSGQGAFDLDGVTGHLRFDATIQPRIEREAVFAEYRDGVAVPLQFR